MEFSGDSLVLKPIGFVRTERVEIRDDFWGETVSWIDLEASQFTEECLFGLEGFSHLEIIYYFHRVNPLEIQFKARHPRNNEAWPQVGIFAQRAKGRPNQLGLSRCQLVERKGLSLKVLHLDAIHQTPVLDIKPYMKEFGPIGPISQPDWASVLMENYYKNLKNEVIQ